MRAVLLTVLAVLLVWQVIAKSFVANLASVAPETALSLAPNHPEALLNVAERQPTRRLQSACQAQPDEPRSSQPSLVPSAPNPTQDLVPSAPNPTQERPDWAQIGARAKALELNAPDAKTPSSSSSGAPVSNDQIRVWAETA